MTRRTTKRSFQLLCNVTCSQFELLFFIASSGLFFSSMRWYVPLALTESRPCQSSILGCTARAVQWRNGFFGKHAIKQQPSEKLENWRIFHGAYPKRAWESNDFLRLSGGIQYLSYTSSPLIFDLNIQQVEKKCVPAAFLYFWRFHRTTRDVLHVIYVARCYLQVKDNMIMLSTSN